MTAPGGIREARAVMAEIAASGLSPVQMALVMELSASLSSEAKPARSKGAERQARYIERHKASRMTNNDANDDNDVTAPPLPKPPQTPQTPTPPGLDIIPTREPLEILFDLLTAWLDDIEKALPTPPGISKNQWRDFLKVRKAKKQPLTPGGYWPLIKKLERFARDGWPPGEVMDLALERGWTTIHEPTRGNGNGHHRPEHEWGRTVAAADSLIADIRAARERDGQVTPGH